MKTIWLVIKETIFAFIEDEALTRGAAIAFYTTTSIGPVLFIVVAIAGIVFGEEAARGAIAQQLGGLMGRDSADLLQTAIANAGQNSSNLPSSLSSGFIAAIVGLVTLLITASGVFTEMQYTLNVIWKTTSAGTPVSRLIKARATSLGLVAAFGFLLLVSLVISTALSALSGYINTYVPNGHFIFQTISFLISFGLIPVLIAAIYKILPDRRIDWHDVLIGAVVTALLFTIGKMGISFYIGSSTIASSYGAAGSLIVVLLWLYYSAQIFLLGAEFTKVYAIRHGSYNEVGTLPPA
jgi:membrane protein